MTKRTVLSVVSGIAATAAGMSGIGVSPEMFATPANNRRNRTPLTITMIVKYEKKMSLLLLSRGRSETSLQHEWS
jgi:hypothetical protein